MYPKYTDLATRTLSITTQKNTIKSDFIAFAESLLTRMAGSNALTADERITFNLKERGCQHNDYLAKNSYHSP